jgi:hypothetical protein
VKFAPACGALAVLALCAFPQRREAPPAAATDVERVVAGLQQAAEGLASWRQAAETGAAIEPADIARLEAALESFWPELEAFGDRFEAELATQEPERAAPAPRNSSPAAVSSRAASIARAWVEDARALGETGAARREEALAAVRAALQGADEAELLAGLQTLGRIGDVAYDKAAFRPLILPHAATGSGPVIVAALYALQATESRPEDIALIHAAWERAPEELLGDVMGLMMRCDGGRLQGRSEEIALEVLAEVRHNVNTQFSGLWGARVGPRLEARLIELARGADGDARDAALYFGLSTLQDKSPAVVEALIAALSDVDHNNWGRALWGLGHGVPEPQRARVVKALVDLHDNRTDPGVREDCARIVSDYGGPAAEARLLR